ncbi:TIGR04282 family arsenosugar biosynthesis glycosyltransferase [Microbulbifer sp. SAOS-129_SWC]|uniref:TIGR04282 family arsenosugar biosynthesis glycosyltransferase n=1 Tax=Microbulbifer sp. SAOS-129_SWC TaxID=3145235 RepID=UPI0032178E09
MANPPRLIVFAKAPLPGVAKTRLIPALGAAGAAALAQRMLTYTLQQCVSAALGPVELCVAPDARHAYWREFSCPGGVQLTAQGPGDLGERLWRAAARALDCGVSPLLLGSDCPQLTARRLRAAATALGDTDAVLHPARDGGYTLLGLNRGAAALFEGIAWSTDRVARQTAERLALCGLRCTHLEVLADIDEPGDLQFLPSGWG